MSEAEKRRFDFTWEHLREREGYDRAFLLEPLLRAEQIVYDIARSTAAVTDEVVRHDRMREAHERERLGVKLALVYLIGEFDATLCRIFAELWDHRRDMLQDWLKNTFFNKDAPGAGLGISFKQIWKPDIEHMSVRDFFRAQVFNRWKKLSPKEKLEDLEAILKPEVDDSIVERIERALVVRNEFVHPTIEEFKQHVRDTPRVAGTEAPPSMSWEEFKKVAGAFVEARQLFEAQAKRARANLIGTNIPNLDRHLTPRQKVVFGTLGRMNGELYKDLESLLAHIQRTIDEERDSVNYRLLVFGVTEEIVSKLGELRDVRTQLGAIPVLLLEYQWFARVGRGHFDAAMRFATDTEGFHYISSHEYPGGKYDETYSWEAALQQWIAEKTGIGI